MFEIQAAWQQNWRNLTYQERAIYLIKIADALDKNAENLAVIIAEEVGKPIAQGIAEVQKSAFACRYFAQSTAEYLKPETLDFESFIAEVNYPPIGLIFSIMPWNFPFWQVFRIAAPAMMAGNAVIIKHAPNVRKCAQAIADLMEGILPKGVFSNLVIEIDEVENIIAHPAISMVTLTGSERAGSAVAALAGKYLKKTLLELGGSDAFIVLADANLEEAAKALVQSRFLNNGQACNAAKRAFIASTIFDIFIEKVKKELDDLEYGEANEKTAFFTHLARIDITEGLQKQVKASLGENTRILYQKGDWDIENRKAPTLLIEVFGESVNQLPIMQEELFGPVLVVQKIDNKAFSMVCGLANDTKYGLCAAVFTENEEAIAYFQAHLNVGFIAINKAVSSDPRLPFGGVKNSGFGRELGAAGIKELCNIQTQTRKR